MLQLKWVVAAVAAVVVDGAAAETVLIAYKDQWIVIPPIEEEVEGQRAWSEQL